MLLRTKDYTLNPQHTSPWFKHVYFHAFAIHSDFWPKILSPCSCFLGFLTVILHILISWIKVFGVWCFPIQQSQKISVPWRESRKAGKKRFSLYTTQYESSSHTDTRKSWSFRVGSFGSFPKKGVFLPDFDPSPCEWGNKKDERARLSNRDFSPGHV